MAKLSISEAARRAGVQRSTIYRKAKKGRVSLERGSDGRQQIDESELLRCWPDASRTPQAAPSVQKRNMQQSGTVAEINNLKRELEVLQQQRYRDDTTLDDLRTERDRLLGIIESTTRQLEGMRAKPGFFRRVFGGKASAAALVIAVLLIGGTAWAAQYTIRGAGTKSCGSWTAAKEKDGWARVSYHAWVQGYLTAYSLWVEKGSGPVSAETDNDGALAWVDKYCQANPLNDVADAAQIVITAIKAK